MPDVDKAPMAIELVLKAEIPKYKSTGPEMFEIDTPTDDKPGGKPKPGVEPTDARVLPLRYSRIGKRLRFWGDVAESIQEVFGGVAGHGASYRGLGYRFLREARHRARGSSSLVNDGLPPQHQ